MSRQGKFTIVPPPGPCFSNANSRSASPAAFTSRPMTSKQVKQAYKEATKTPKRTKAEQRQWERDEQERIRKEFEKEKSAAKAKAAREKKKAKEQAEMEEKKRKRQPLFKVRPSQDTIARFVRGNGSGKKRDSTGSAVEAEDGELSAIDERSGTSSPEKEDTPAASQIVAAPEAAKDHGSREKPKQADFEVAADPIESFAPELPAPVDKLNDPIVDEFDDLGTQDEDSLERVFMEAETTTAKPSAAHPHHTVKLIGLSKPGTRLPNESIESTPLPALIASIEEDFFGASLNDSDLTAAFDLDGPTAPNAPTVLKQAAVKTGDDLFADLDLDLFPADDELDLDILDKLEAANTTRTALNTNTTHQPSPKITKMAKMANATFTKPNNPQPIPRSVPTKAPKSSLQTRPVQTRSIQPSLPQMHTPAAKLPNQQTAPKLQTKQPETVFIKPALPAPSPRRTRSSSYGSSSPIPHIPTPPMSTQAIFSNLDDLFPSSSQQARELEEEFPSPVLPLKATLPVAPSLATRAPSQRIPSQRAQLQRTPSDRVPSQPKSQQAPTQQPTRFFTSSGGREQLSLALQRSRRSAAMEQLQEKERLRREAGLALQQQKANERKASVPNKENIAPPVPASQESDYGGQWLDDIALDLAF